MLEGLNVKKRIGKKYVVFLLTAATDAQFNSSTLIVHWPKTLLNINADAAILVEASTGKILY